MRENIQKDQHIATERKTFFLFLALIFFGILSAQGFSTISLGQKLTQSHTLNTPHIGFYINLCLICMLLYFLLYKYGPQKILALGMLVPFFLFLGLHSFVNFSHYFSSFKETYFLVILFLFWKHANLLFTPSQARKFYGLFIMFGSICGYFIKYFLMRYALVKGALMVSSNNGSSIELNMHIFPSMLHILTVGSGLLFAYFYCKICNNTQAGQISKKQNRIVLLPLLKKVVLPPHVWKIFILFASYMILQTFLKRYSFSVQHHASGNAPEIYAQTSLNLDMYTPLFSFFLGLLAIIFLRLYPWKTSILMPFCITFLLIILLAICYIFPQEINAFSSTFPDLIRDFRHWMIIPPHVTNASILALLIVFLWKCLSLFLMVLFIGSREISFIPLTPAIKNQGKALIDFFALPLISIACTIQTTTAWSPSIWHFTLLLPALAAAFWSIQTLDISFNKK